MNCHAQDFKFDSGLYIVSFCFCSPPPSQLPSGKNSFVIILEGEILLQRSDI